MKPLFSGVKSELKKALTTTGDGEGLVAPDLEQALYEELLKLQPLAMLLNVEQANGLNHEYRIRTSHPMAWFEGETAGPNPKNSGYQRRTVRLKIQRIWGSVTGFAQAMDEAFVNALAEELQGSIEGFSNLMEYGVLWGESNDGIFTGDEYQYNGIIPRIFAYAPENVIDAGGEKVSLDLLDLALAQTTRYRQVRSDPRLWIMGLRMKLVVDGLQTKVQLPLTQAELADGKVVMAAYGNAAILESDYMVPAEPGAFPGALAAEPADGGTLPDLKFAYRIASVTMFGEQVASLPSNDVTCADTKRSVNLTWVPDPEANLYLIFRRVVDDPDPNFYLLDIAPAKVYNNDGEVVGLVSTYTDEGRRWPIMGVKPLEEGEQNILLVNYHPVRGASLIGKVDDMGRPIDQLISYVELARTKDSYDYFLKSYHALKVPYPNLHCVIRHVKVQ